METYSKKKTYNRNNAKASTVNAFFKDVFKTLTTNKVIHDNVMMLPSLRLKATATVEETIYDCGTHNVHIEMETYYIYNGVQIPIHDVGFSCDGYNFDGCYTGIKIAFDRENFEKTQRTVDTVMRVMDGLL